MVRPTLRNAATASVGFAGLLAVAWLLTIPCTARAESHTFTVSLDGRCAGTNSAATGEGTFTLDTETGKVLYEIRLRGLIPDVVQVHGPADVCINALGVGNEIIFPFKNGISGSFTISPADVEPMLLAKLWILGHTELFLAGDILGQILPDCPNVCSGRGTCDVGECTCDPGWIGDACGVDATIPTLSQWGLATMTALLVVIGGLTVLKRARAAS